MEITNLGQADGLPPVDWAAVAEKLDAGSAPAPDALNSRTTWLSAINDDTGLTSPAVLALSTLDDCVPRSLVSAMGVNQAARGLGRSD